MSSLMMRIAGLEGYRELVTELGGQPGRLIQDAELHEHWFDLPDHLIPAWKGCKLLELSERALNCPTFGLRLSQKQSLAILGPLGLMLERSGTLEMAIQDLKRFLHVHSQAGNIQLSSSGSLVHITYDPLVSFEDSARQLIDLSLAVGYSILSGLSNRSFSLVSAYFTYKQPDDHITYKQFFGCPVIYGAAENGVTIQRRVLESSLSQSQDNVRGFLSAYLQDRKSALQSGIDENLRVLIRQLLPLGKCRLDIISSALSIDKRTLQRRLKEIDTTFQALVDAERKQLALQYVKESDLSMAQISELLGYSDPSIFSRSFKSWFEMSPAAFVKRHRLRWKYR